MLERFIYTYTGIGVIIALITFVGIIYLVIVELQKDKNPIDKRIKLAKEKSKLLKELSKLRYKTRK